MDLLRVLFLENLWAEVNRKLKKCTPKSFDELEEVKEM